MAITALTVRVKEKKEELSVTEKEIFTVWDIGPDLCVTCVKLDLLERTVNSLIDPALYILFQVCSKCYNNFKMFVEEVYSKMDL